MGERITSLLLEWMGQLDYFAIFVLMAMESSIFPVPSELVMIPAGYLISIGKLGWTGSVVASSLGSIVGSLGSYYLALWLGTPIILRFGRYFLITEKHLQQTETFFARHGEISIFTGRFIPGVRHLISMPAGLGRMRIPPFLLYTFAGATLWNIILLVFGFLIGENQEWVKRNTHWVVLAAVLFAVLVIGGYLLWRRSRKATA
ncbi:MAG: DedA family protein [Magnetococcales bacterium]|nr:DedA family protein [Magnetococcales bacterium]